MSDKIKMTVDLGKEGCESIAIGYLENGSSFLAPKNNSRMTILRLTIVPPTGKFNQKARYIPQMSDRTENKMDKSIVFLKPTDNCNAVRGGKISMAETSIIPATFIAKTAAMAVNINNRVLIFLVWMPID